MTTPKKTLAALLLAVSAFLGLPGAVHADPIPESRYAYCYAVWEQPRTDAADACRAKGWVVRSRFLRDPRGIVRHIYLDRCRLPESQNCFTLDLATEQGSAHLQGRRFTFRLPLR